MKMMKCLIMNVMTKLQTKKWPAEKCCIPPSEVHPGFLRRGRKSERNVD
jgi:hypothetical protein